MLRLDEMRTIVQGNMPYDTGFMFLSGSQYFATEHFNVAFYDIKRVPYIVYNELGTKFTKKNKGFISERTVGAMNRYAGYQSTGQKSLVIGQYQDENNRRGSLNMIKQGALEKISSEGFGMTR